LLSSGIRTNPYAQRRVELDSDAAERAKQILRGERSKRK
jgi:hypothetical protein